MTTETRTGEATPRRDQVAAQLQPVLLDLIDLSLQAKQAHWNVTGPNFVVLHRQFDELVGDARRWADEVAERMVALGTPARGQAADLTNGSGLEPLPPGQILDHAAAKHMASRIERAVGRARRAMEALGDVDLPSQDLLVDVVRGLEKHLWMFRSL